MVRLRHLDVVQTNPSLTKVAQHWMSIQIDLWQMKQTGHVYSPRFINDLAGRWARSFQTLIPLQQCFITNREHQVVSL